MALGTLAACSASRRDIPREIPQQEGASEGPQRQEEIAREVRSELIVSGEVESLDSSSSPSTLGEDASLDDYILFALKASSELKSAFASYRAALQKSPQVSTLPDPTLNYGYFIKEVETRVGPQEQKVGLMQPIPWFGKLSLKGEIADSEAKAAFYAFLAKKNKLVTDVTDAYFELAYLKSASEITDANFELLKRWEQVVAQKYRSQTGTQADLIKVQVELGKLEDKLKELKDLEAPLLARFNALLNRESYLAVSVSQDALAVFSDELRKRFTKLDQQVLESSLAENNPELLYVDALIEAKNSGIDLANKNFYPDFGIGADYVFVGDRGSAGSESGDDALVGMFSITLPLYRSKYKAGLSQAKSEKRSAEEMKKAKTYALHSQLAKGIFDIKDSDRKIKLYEHTLVPKAEESLESTYTAFEAGESTFLDLLDAERIFLEFKLSLARAQADYQIANAELSALLGDFSSVEDNRMAKGVQ